MSEYRSAIEWAYDAGLIKIGENDSLFKQTYGDDSENPKGRVMLSPEAFKRFVWSEFVGDTNINRPCVYSDSQIISEMLEGFREVAESYKNGGADHCKLPETLIDYNTCKKIVEIGRKELGYGPFPENEIRQFFYEMNSEKKEEMKEFVKNKRYEDDIWDTIKNVLKKGGTIATVLSLFSIGAAAGEKVGNHHFKKTPITKKIVWDYGAKKQLFEEKNQSNNNSSGLFSYFLSSILNKTSKKAGKRIASYLNPSASTNDSAISLMPTYNISKVYKDVKNKIKENVTGKIDLGGIFKKITEIHTKKVKKEAGWIYKPVSENVTSLKKLTQEITKAIYKKAKEKCVRIKKIPVHFLNYNESSHRMEEMNGTLYEICFSDHEVVPNISTQKREVPVPWTSGKKTDQVFFSTESDNFTRLKEMNSSTFYKELTRKLMPPLPYNGTNATNCKLGNDTNTTYMIFGEHDSLVRNIWTKVYGEKVMAILEIPKKVKNVKELPFYATRKFGLGTGFLSKIWAKLLLLPHRPGSSSPYPSKSGPSEGFGEGYNNVVSGPGEVPR